MNDNVNYGLYLIKCKHIDSSLNNATSVLIVTVDDEVEHEALIDDCRMLLAAHLYDPLQYVVGVLVVNELFEVLDLDLIGRLILIVHA